MMPESCFFFNLSLCVCVSEELYLYGMTYCNISPQALGYNLLYIVNVGGKNVVLENCNGK